MNRVNVYESEFCNKIVARVKYNEKLDYWDGRNRGNGGLGMHKGITKLRQQVCYYYRFSISRIKDYAYIVSKERGITGSFRVRQSGTIGRAKIC